MNTVKRWLAGFLSFAMIFTSASFTQLGALNVFAEENPYHKDAPVYGEQHTWAANVTDGTKLFNIDVEFDGSAITSKTSNPQVQYSDNVPLKAVVKNKSTAGTVAQGETIYEWSVEYNEGTDAIDKWEILKDDYDVAVTGTEQEFSFDAKEVPAMTRAYRVTLTTKTSYTKDGVRGIEANTTIVEITVVKKEVFKDALVGPSLNTVYKPEGTVKNMFGEENGKGYVTVGYLRAMAGGLYDTLDFIDKDEQYVAEIGAGWEIDASIADNTKLFVGEPTPIKFRFRVADGSEYYAIGDSGKAGWTAGTGESYIVSEPINVTVEEAENYVTGVTDFSLTGVTGYYNKAVLTDSSFESLRKVSAEFAYTTQNERNVQNTLPSVKTNDTGVEGSVSYVGSAGGKVLAVTLEVVGPIQHKDGNVAVTVYDDRGTGFSATATFHVCTAVREDDVPFVTVSDTYNISGGNKLVNVWDAWALNDKEAGAINEEKTHITYSGYTAKIGEGETNFVVNSTSPNYRQTAIEVNDVIEYKASYALQTNEMEIVLDNGKYVVDKTDAFIIADPLVRVTVVGNEVTEENILDAISRVSFANGDALAGGTHEYGADLETLVNTSTSYISVEGYADDFYLVLNKVDKNGNKTPIVDGTSEIPAIGEHSDYVFTVVKHGGQIPNSLLTKTYPIDFTITKANLIGMLSGGESTQYVSVFQPRTENFRNAEGTNLKAIPTTANGYNPIGDYTDNPVVVRNVGYQWYENGKAISEETNDVLASEKVKVNNSYYCEITVAPVAGRSGKLDESKLTVVTPTFFVGTAPVIVDNGTSALGTIERTYMSPGNQTVRISTNDTAATLGETKIYVKSGSKVVVDPVEVPVGKGNSYTYTYRTPIELGVGLYEIWVSSSAVKVDANGTEVVSEFDEKVGGILISKNDGVSIFDTVNKEVDLLVNAGQNINKAVAKNVVEVDGKKAITYGQIPSDALAYTFALADNKNYTDEEVAFINENLNDNFTFTVKASTDTKSNVGSKKIDLAVTPIAIGFDSTNFNKTSAPYYYEDFATITVEPKEVNLVTDEESYTWVEGQQNEITAHYVEEDFVAPDTAKSLSLDWDYDILDADGKKITLASIKPGEYTVQLKAVGSAANYTIKAGTAKLTIKSDAQADADAFVKAVGNADLTKEADVKALEEAYAALRKDAQALVPEETLKAVTDARKNLDAVAAAQAAVAKATAAGATDADIAAAQDALAKLTDVQKAIYGEDALKAAQDAVKKAADDAAAKKAADEEAKKKAADQDAANKVIAQLAGINSSSTQAQAKAAVDAYNALTAAQKALVDANPTAAANLKTAQSRAATPDKTKTTFTYKNAKKTIKASKVKKAKQTFTFKAKAKSGGKVTYKKASGSKKVTISKKGKVTVKKGTKKGTYKIKVKCTAAAKGNFLKTTVKKQITVKVK